MVAFASHCDRPCSFAISIAASARRCAAANSRREVVQERGEVQGKGEAVDVREPFGEGQPSFETLQGAVGKAEEPENPCRKQPAHDAGALRVKQKVSGILPARDPIVDRDALVQSSPRIRKPAEIEQRRTASAARQGAVNWFLLLLRERDQPFGQIKGPPQLATHQMMVP
jgi:hypothetical protein